jgi:hypothetical protein
MTTPITTARAIVRSATLISYEDHRRILRRERRGSNILMWALFCSLLLNVFAAYAAFWAHLNKCF